ncbi:MAG: hypothetical protein WDM76_16265 [Limisphaerales bacterium]
MFDFSKRISIVVFVLAFVMCSHAVVLVNDTWQDGMRTDPASPVYSENGTDTDADGDLESAWFNTGGTLTPSPGHLVGTMPANGTSSASWTTYFTPEASPVTLANAGDALQVTWVFTPTTVAVLRIKTSALPWWTVHRARGAPAMAVHPTVLMRVTQCL